MANKNAQSTVKLNMAVIRKLDQAAKVSLVQTADAVMGDVRSRGIMPFDTGTLQNDNTFVDDSAVNSGRVDIVSSTPYARRLYYHPEYNFSKDENPNAGGKWLEDYKKGGSKQDLAVEAFKAHFKRNSGV